MVCRNQLTALMVAVGLCLSLVATGRAQQPPAAGEAPSRWIDAQTVGVVRVKVAELLRSTTPERVSQAMQQAGLDAAAAAELQQIEQRVRLLGEQFVQAGGDEVWLVLSLADVRAGAPLIIVRGAADRDTSGLGTWLQAQPQALEAPGLQVSQVDANTWLVAHPSTLQRLTQLQPDERPELVSATTALRPYPVSVILALGAEQRRIIRETLPPLPEPWHDATGELLADGIRWCALSANPGARSKCNHGWKPATRPRPARCKA